MIIDSIEWLSESADEAIIIISDGQFSVAAFSHPFTKDVGEFIDNKLHLLDTKIIKLSDNKDYFIKRNGMHLAHFACMCVIDTKSRILKVGNIFFESDIDLPKDISDGDFVEISCSRIDVW